MGQLRNCIFSSLHKTCESRVWKMLIAFSLQPVRVHMKNRSVFTYVDQLLMSAFISFRISYIGI